MTKYLSVILNAVLHQILSFISISLDLVVYFNTMTVVQKTWHWMVQRVLKKELDMIQREAVVL